MCGQQDREQSEDVFFQEDPGVNADTSCIAGNSTLPLPSCLLLSIHLSMFREGRFLGIGRVGGTKRFCRDCAPISGLDPRKCKLLGIGGGEKGCKMFLFFFVVKGKEIETLHRLIERGYVSLRPRKVTESERRERRKLRHFSAECPDLRRSSRSLLIDGNVEQSYSNKTRRRRP